MTDELGRRIDEVAERVPPGTADVASVVQRGRRARRLRLAGRSLGVAALLVALVFVAIKIGIDPATPGRTDAATHDDGEFVPAGPGEPTYVLTDFRIEYPWARVDGLRGMDPGSEERERYCSHPEHEAACEAEGNAGFFYEWRWATQRFPGTVECRVILFAGNGDEVGRQTWGLSMLERKSRRPSDVLVHVSAPPEHAEAGCEAGTPEERATVVFTYAGSEPYDHDADVGGDLPERIRLFFEVERLVTDPHGAHVCTMRIRFETGRRTKSSFNMQGVPRQDIMKFDTGLPASDPIEDASLTCRPYRKPVKSSDP